MKGKGEIIVLSVGGSLIFPGEIDSAWIGSFRNLIEKQVRKGKRFVIITGGGKIARKYQNAAKELTKLDGEDLDWLGIHCTRLNAHLMRTVFKDIAHPSLVKDPNTKVKFKENVLIAAGWKPGFSTDYDAVLIAKNLKIKKMANLTNIDYVYDKDPNKHNDAQPIDKISWKKFRKLIPKKWDPGLNSPFDPVAAAGADKLGMEVAILNGANLRNLENYLDGKEFVGTLIN
ncbi:MAG: UMP kinase [archaeon]